ncbi:High mobility group protein 20A [Lachnellula hyalina]|uniref:High mobility group protein 20A n=1 Tax=Lachnellula hyalina TaxID=1316788 RepID=A0A8H8RBS2_9HELO|nr:High mobility group protein 20A [Lachnellula hyalina]TVY30441.1 High mobility group protein 20A [Lachnellula hyalina]
MTELVDIFAELGISHYLEDFIDQGFDTWDTILDITESDFDALGVKLGHRRKLQRKIANSRGLSSDRALASPRHTPSEDRQPEEQKAGATKADAREGVAAHGAKRKYRRHPKPDDNAPERPPSAYVIFSNKMREDLKGRNLSFTEIAKLVGENWQNISPDEKEPYEQQASSAKERYNNELAEYKKTSSYKDYSQYLVEFKARQLNQQQVTDLEIAKRPKLEPHVSNGSSGTASSCASQHGADIPIVRARVGSATPSNGPWLAEGYSPAGVSKLNVAGGPSNSQSSPNTSSPSFLPGYRESIYGGTQQSLPWRDVQREDNPAPQKLSHLASISDRRSSPPSLHNSDSPILTGSVQHHPHRTAPTQSHPPPLLSSESTNRSASSASTSSYFTPHTPMEPPPERALPIPSLYPQKSYETQLPPLRPPSLSPQSASLSSQQSPIAISSFFEHPSSMAPMRGFTATSPQNIGHAERPDTNSRDFISQSTNDDNNLDPVSALLKAGEIVNRNSRYQQNIT